jgi:hypothetical protein
MGDNHSYSLIDNSIHQLEPMQYGTDNTHRVSTSSLFSRKLSRSLLSDGKCNPYLLRTLILGLFGGIVGGPCGFAIVKLFHLGSSASFWIPFTSFWTGAGAGSIVANKIQRRSDPDYKLFWNSGDAAKDRLQECLKKDNLEEVFPTFLAIFTNEDRLNNWYRRRIKMYHQSESASEALAEAKFLLEDLTELVGEVVQTNTNLNSNSNDHEKTIMVIVCVERFVMMSLYWDLMGQCRDLETVRDREYMKKRCKPENTQVEVPQEAIYLLNGLVNKQTVSLKISCILAVSEILSTYTESSETVSCDVLLEKFVSAVCRSSIRHPFAELYFMDTFSPQGLKGKESYAVSSFMASVYYVANSE